MQQERSLFVLWGPSRVSIGRHLPRILSLNLYKQKKYEVVIKADSGQEIAEPLVDEIIVFIFKHYPRKQVHLIILREVVFSFFEQAEQVKMQRLCRRFYKEIVPAYIRKVKLFELGSMSRGIMMFSNEQCIYVL